MFQATGSRQCRRRKNWYSGGGQFESVIFVEPTPDSCFKKEVQQAAKESKLKIKVVEKVSTTVKKLLQKSNPFEKEICGRVDCEMCRLGCKDDCRTRGCVYEIKCKDCDRKYRGTTGRTAYHRTGQHIDDWTRRKSCPMWEHSREYHNGEVYEYEMKIVSKCFGKPTKRMITEAVVIDEVDEDKAMNRKSEWGYVRLPRVESVVR